MLATNCMYDRLQLPNKLAVIVNTYTLGQELMLVVATGSLSTHTPLSPPSPSPISPPSSCTARRRPGSAAAAAAAARAAARAALRAATRGRDSSVARRARARDSLCRTLPSTWEQQFSRRVT